MPRLADEISGVIQKMNTKQKLLAVGTVALGLASNAFAAADTDISTATADTLLTWAIVKAGMIGIGVFLVAFSFFKRIKRA